MTAAVYVKRDDGGPDLRGNSTDRRRRKEWLIAEWRADVDVDGQPACRCYRCGELLTLATLTVDRITPGLRGGRYTRDNVRPACGFCNSSTGSALRYDEGQPW